MILSIIDWIIIIVALLLFMGLGLSYSKKAGKNMDSFFLGGRSLPWHIAGLSMVATTFAADTPLAVAEMVEQNGIAGNWLWWSALAGGMLTTLFFANLWYRSGVLTEVELIELRYSGPEAAFLRGFKAIYLGLFMNCIIIGWVNTAMSSILQVFFDLTSNQALFYTGIAMLFTAIYSSVSGLLGVAMTDAVQFFVAMIGCIVLSILVVTSPEIGGIDGLMTKVNNVAPGSFNFLPVVGNESGGTAKVLGYSFLAFITSAGFRWWASWYPGAEPGGGGYVAQRIMSSKSEKDSVYATLFFQVGHYCLRPWPWILVGLAAIVLYPELQGTGNERLGFVYAMRDFLPDGFKGLLLVAFFSAYMSTISTQLNWGSSYLVNDLYKRFIYKRNTKSKMDIQLKQEAEDKHFVLVSRLVTIVVMFIGLAVSSQINSISGMWKFVMNCGAGLGLVLILRWYWWRINAWSEITATIAPFIGYPIFQFIYKLLSKNYIIEEDVVYLATILFTTISWITVTFLTRPTNFDTLKNFFLKVRPDGNWQPIIEHFSLQKKESNILKLLVCWLMGIIFTYSTLFFIGKLIFKEYSTAGILFITMIISFFIFRFFIQKTNIFDNTKF
jgi:SSS family solute:Na+ symporter